MRFQGDMKGLKSRLRGEIATLRINHVVNLVKRKWRIKLGQRVWNAVMTGLIRCRAAEIVLKLFERTEKSNTTCFNTYLKALDAAD